LFPVYLAIVVCAGLYLRDGRVSCALKERAS